MLTPVPMPPCGARRAIVRAFGLTCLLMISGGCGVGERGDAGGTLINIDRPVRIPPNSAHTSFQGGRQVAGTSKLEPYCELEIKTVSTEPQQVQPGIYRVSGGRYALLKDPTTRLPALFTGFSCSDAVYQESLWLMRGPPEGNLHSLRCIRPLFHCFMAPPLTLYEAEDLTGSAFSIVPPGSGASANPGP